MLKQIFLLLSWVGVQSAIAQSPALIDSILSHNTTLQALQGQHEADQIQNRSDLRWEDPEAEVGYTFGTPKGVEAQTSLSVTQSVDWALLTGQTKKRVRATNEKRTQIYLAERQKIAAEVRRQLTRLIYYNRLCAELQERLLHAREVQELYQTRYSTGDINQIEWNKVCLNTGITKAELSRARTEQQYVLLDLQRLNGDRPLTCTDTVYSLAPLPALIDFQEMVVNRHPVLMGAEAAVNEAEQAVKVARAQAFPALEFGYSGDYTKGLRSNGFTVGVSLPLWGKNRMKIKENRTRLMANRLDLTDVQLQLRTSVARQYASMTTLQNCVSDLQRDLTGTDNTRLLRRSLEEGHISLLDYLLELSFFYTARTAFLEAERDAKLAQADLWSLVL